MITSSIESSTGTCVQLLNSSTGNNFSITYNCTGLGLRQTTIKINVTDVSGATGSSSQLANSFPNQIPIISEVNISSTDPLNRENGSLIGSWAVSDIDNDVLINQTKWLLKIIITDNVYRLRIGYGQ